MSVFPDSVFGSCTIPDKILHKDALTMLSLGLAGGTGEVVEMIKSMFIIATYLMSESFKKNWVMLCGILQICVTLLVYHLKKL